jgi:hypothetical protein
VTAPRRAGGDQRRGRAPAPGLLACFECHGEAPAVNNFGNILAGHNAVALIRRAVAPDTGGMGCLPARCSADDLADIAARLGNTPTPVRIHLAGTRARPPALARLTPAGVASATLVLQAQGSAAVAAVSMTGAAAAAPAA